jgi:UDP-glucose 4-epimerase
MNKVMVTGVAGLIGSHLAERLLEEGYEVHGTDIVDLGSTNNLLNIKNNSNFKYYQGDIRSKEDLEKFFQHDSDVIYHLASVVGVNRYMEDPLSLIDISVIGTKALIELCQVNQVRMLFTSTSEVYGRNTEIPWNEDEDRVLGPTNVDRWCYSTAKALCEHMLFGVHHNNGWPMSIIRFFNVYGPRQNPIYVVSKSIYSAMKGLQPELYDGGKQTRCFTYIGDVVDGIILSATKENVLGQVINLGNPIEKSMKEVMDIVIRETSFELSYLNVETQNKYGKVYEDIPRRVPNVDKAKELLGWTPKTTVEEGIKRTVDWVKKNPWYLD